MISKLIGAMALALVALVAQAQGVVTPLRDTKGTSVSSPSPPVEAATPSVSAGFNPFKPPAPAAAPSLDGGTAPPVDPVIAAIAEEMRTIREEGERIGVLNGKVIFRHEGRYLIEAVPTSDESDGAAAIDPAKRQAALAGKCVIRIVTDGSKTGVAATASEAASKKTP